jgi:2-iminobutanoate/2-iminopropanoate deaminase
MILVDASRGVLKAGVCTEPLARDYATLPFGLSQMKISSLLNVSSVYLPVESNAVNRGVRFTLKATPLLRSSETARSGTRRHHREVLAYICIHHCDAKNSDFFRRLQQTTRWRLMPGARIVHDIPNNRDIAASMQVDVIFGFRKTLAWYSFLKKESQMSRVPTLLLTMLLATAAQAAEYMEKTPFQLSRAFSPGVITSGGMTVWVAGQTATQDSQGNNIANNFEAQVKQVFAQVDGVLKRAGGSLDNVVAMTVFIKESRYGDKFVEMRKDFFKNGNYPGSALITVTNFARPGIEIEIQAVGVIGDTCSSDNPCSAERKAKQTQK